MADVVIYTRRFCGYCDAARRLLQRKQAAFSEIDVSDDPSLRQTMVARAHGHRTLPQIFIGETHVGGCDELYDLEQAGGLDALLVA